MESEDSFSGVSVKEYNFFHLELPAMLLAKWKNSLALYGVIIQREHLVGGDIKISGKYLVPFALSHTCQGGRPGVSFEKQPTSSKE